MFKAGPFREGHNVFPQSMLLAAILTRFKGGHIESTGHNVFPQMMLFFFQFLQGARTHTSQGDECSGARPLRDSYGTLTGPFGPIRIQTNANSCNSIWNEADHGIHCPSMALVLVYPKLRRSTESDTHAFKMDQSTEPDNFIPTKGNSSKQLRLQTNWRVSITNHFDLC